MEMVTGHPPFESQNRYQLFEDIRNADVKIPKNVHQVIIQLSPKLQSLLKGLLEKNSKKRLGAKGAGEVKKHAWFDTTNWQAVLNRTIKAPFIPMVSSETDISNFDVEFTSTEVESYKSGDSHTEEPLYQGKQFPDAGFSY